MGAKGALRKFCLTKYRVKKWVSTPCVYTQNAQFFEENPIVDENQIGQNMNTTHVQRYVRSGPYPSGKAVPLQLEALGSNPSRGNVQSCR